MTDRHWQFSSTWRVVHFLNNWQSNVVYEKEHYCGGFYKYLYINKCKEGRGVNRAREKYAKKR